MENTSGFGLRNITGLQQIEAIFYLVDIPAGLRYNATVCLKDSLIFFSESVLTKLKIKATPYDAFKFIDYNQFFCFPSEGRNIFYRVC
jgi:hypothetical protein